MSIADNRLCREFEVERKGDYEDRLAIAGKLRYTLEQLAAGTIPKEAYSHEDMQTLAESLVTGQRPAQGDLPQGSWAVAEPFGDLPEDEFLDMVMYPTILAAALLSRMAEKGILPLDNLRKEALQKAFAFIAAFPFGGEGMDHIFQQNEMILLLGLGRIPELLKETDLSPELLDILMERKRIILSRVEKGDLRGQYGEDYTQGYQLALSALKNL